MSDALAIAASGLKAEEFYIDKIANDLANLNTNSYKASKLTFEDALYRNIHNQNIHANESSPDSPATPQIGLGTIISSATKDFSSGPLKPTGSWHDIAIDGPGFLQVINTDGNIVYTRNSSLSIDEERFLTTQDGFRLADNIQIPEDALDIFIQKNGDVEITLNDESEPQALGTIRLAKFMDPDGLKTLGSGLYASTELTGEPLIDVAGSSGMGVLMQKHVEGSNVDMVHALMQLTMAQRIYQLNAKTVQVADELEKLVNELRD